MRNMFVKARVLPLAAALTFGVGSYVVAPSPAQALTVYCTNCSTVFSQALQLARDIETAINTWEQLQTQIQQYENMLKQGLSLPSSMFNRMTSDLQRLQSLYQQSKSLAGSLSNFDERFREQFGDYSRYLSQNGQNPGYMTANYKRWSEQGFDAMRVAMQASGQNVSAIASEDAMLAQLVARSQNAAGRMQAIQVGNEIAAQQVQQLQKLRQMLDAQIQSQSMWYAQQIERQTIDDAFREQYRSAPVQNSAAKEF